MIDAGLRLRNVGSEEFNWHDFVVFVRESKRDSALMRAAHPDRYLWGQLEYMMADLIDIGNYQLWAAAGGKKRDKPDPYPRPAGAKADTDTEKKQVKGTAVPMDQLYERLRQIQGG